jgi:AGCS family alanine or glycine:cation symporter
LQFLEHLLEQVGNVVWVLAVMIGSVASPKMVWKFADITNGLMAIPNLISLIVLNKVIVSETRARSRHGLPRIAARPSIRAVFIL